MSMLLLFFLFSLSPQPKVDAAPQSRQKAPAWTALDATRATMKAAGFCFLITVDDQGQPQARVLNPFDPDQDMKVWLGTNRNTRKVSQIRKNSRVTLAYFDRQSLGYVTLLGKARLVDSLEERKRRWKKEWAEFYPGGPEGPTYLLIEFTALQIEVMSAKYRIASDPLAWKPAILVRQGQSWELKP